MVKKKITVTSRSLRSSKCRSLHLCVNRPTENKHFAVPLFHTCRTFELAVGQPTSWQKVRQIKNGRGRGKFIPSPSHTTWLVKDMRHRIAPWQAWVGVPRLHAFLTVIGTSACRHSHMWKCNHSKPAPMEIGPDRSLFNLMQYHPYMEITSHHLQNKITKQLEGSFS